MPLTDEQVNTLTSIFDRLNSVGVNDFKIQKAVRNLTRYTWMTLDPTDLSVLRQMDFDVLTRRLGGRLQELEEQSAVHTRPFSSVSSHSAARTFFAFTEAAQFQTESAFNMDEWESGVDFEEP